MCRVGLVGLVNNKVCDHHTEKGWYVIEIYMLLNFNPPGAENGIFREKKDNAWLLMPWWIKEPGHQQPLVLTYWGRVTHICVSKLTIIGSDNGLSPDRRQGIIWNNAGLLLIEPLATNFSEILIEIHISSFKKMHLKCRTENGGHFVLASLCSVYRT